MLILHFIVVLVPIISCARLPQPISEYQSDLNEDSYRFSYKTDDSERFETGIIENSNGESRLIRIDGTYSYLGDDGKKYEVEYQADENGFRPIVKIDGEIKFQVDNLEKPPQPLEKSNEVPFVPYLGSAAIASLVGGGLG